MYTKNSKGFQANNSVSKRSSAGRSRRTIKLMVEMSIGIIGLIGIMLAQIADRQSSQLPTVGAVESNYRITDVQGDLTDRVENFSQVSPAVSQITLANIFF